MSYIVFILSTCALTVMIVKIVVVQKLNKLKIAKAIGSMPENVNFGMKASTVRQF